MIANADLVIFVLIFAKFFRNYDMMYNIYYGAQLIIRTSCMHLELIHFPIIQK